MKKNKEKRNSHKRVCERCGNGGYCKKPQFKCRHCGWLNGYGAEEYGVEITRGGYNDGR